MRFRTRISSSSRTATSAAGSKNSARTRNSSSSTGADAPSHLREDVEYAKFLHPNAKLLVHPECREEVTSLADYAGSTTGIMKYAQESEDKEFIIGTENSIVQHLQFSCPDKKFYPLSVETVCPNMRATTLADVYAAVVGEGGEEIKMSEEVMTGSVSPFRE
jgi:quinolinate synthase